MKTPNKSNNTVTKEDKLAFNKLVYAGVIRTVAKQIPDRRPKK